MADPADPNMDPVPDAEPDPEPVFKAITSQEEFDRRVQARIARVKNTPPADYEELKLAAKRLEELEAASATDLEKAQKRADEAERRAEAAAAKAQESLLRAAVTNEAAKRNVVDPDGAYALLDKTEIEFGSDGSPLNIADAMESLLQAKPYLVAAGGARAGSADQGARTPAPRAGQLTRADLQNMSDAEIVQAHNEGRFADVVSGQA